MITKAFNTVWIVFICSNTNPTSSSDLNEPKTKALVNFLLSRGLNNKKVLFLADSAYIPSQEEQGLATASERHANISLSLRNIPKAKFINLRNINGYELMCSDHIILMEPAFAELKELLEGTV